MSTQLTETPPREDVLRLAAAMVTLGHWTMEEAQEFIDEGKQ